MAFIRKRAAQLFSKSRFIAAQFDAYFEDGLWLETARHANAMAARLAGHIARVKERPARLGAAGQRGLRDHDAQTSRTACRKKGAMFYDWHTPHGFDGDARRRTKRSAASSPASRRPPRTSTRSAS